MKIYNETVSRSILSNPCTRLLAGIESAALCDLSRNTVRWLVSVLLLFLLAGCATDQRWKDPLSPDQRADNPFIRIDPRDPVVAETRPTADPDDHTPTASPFDDLTKLRHLADPPVSGPQAPGSIFGDAPTEPQPTISLQLAFDNADLHEVLDATLYELFDISYMVDPSIRSKVTFHVSGEYTRGAFINLLNQVLQLNNLAVVRGPGNILKIVNRPASPSVGDVHRGMPDDADAEGDITRLLRLTYLAAPMAAGSITPFLSRGAVVLQDTVNNAIIITDTYNNIEKAAAILGALDIPYFRNISWQVFPVRHVEAADMAKELDALFKSGTFFNRPGAVEGSFEIFPISTLNAILVLSRWPEILDIVADWVPIFDQSDETGTDVFVYFVENGSAAELADILKQVYGGGGGSTTARATRDTIVAPSRTSDQPSPTPRPAASAQVMGDVEIIADETNNALVFKATPRDYRSIQNVLKQLDIVPRQVLINVVIAEVNLSSELKYGVEWFMTKNVGAFSGGDYTAQGTLGGGISRPIDTPLASAATGFTFSVYDPTHFLRGLINLVDSDSDVSILSSPNILAVDNKEAVIEVGDEVPTRTGDHYDSSDRRTTSYQYRKTGIILRVTPQISSTGLVKIDLQQEVSQPGEFLQELDNYSFLTRKVHTSLVVEDGQTIVIAGLMRSRSSESQSGVPFLNKIPWLGRLFGSTTQEMSKTELVLMLTPHVISTRSEADRITREFSNNISRMRNISGTSEDN